MRIETAFVEQARRQPTRPAVVAGGETWSYDRLNERAATIAGALGPVAGRPPRRVGICLERGPDAYAALLAALLAGAAYVPINPHHPEQRIHQVLDQADLDVIVADAAGLEALAGAAAEAARHCPVLTVEPDGLGTDEGRAAGLTVVGADAISAAVPCWQGPVTGPDEPAYLLFTSGSTGRPKGVPITHGNVCSFLDANRDHHRLGSDDRCSQTFDLTFDLSVFDLFLAWRAGACLFPAGPGELLDPVGFVNENRLTMWFSVPAVAALARQRRTLSNGTMPTLTTSLFCGEALPVEVAGAWADAAPASVVENLYGPTELTIACTRYRWHDRTPTEARLGVVPLGRPFPDLRTVVVDPNGDPVPPGTEGELCVDGPQRFDGYWRAPHLTADRTLAHDGRSLYRTGDRVVADGEGCLHYLGRTDHQVQVQGHRVELGEVEAALRTLGDVVDAVVFPLPLGEPVVTHLGAAVTVADGSAEDPRALRRLAAEHLPASMRPKWIEIVDRFPLNVNGKIDRPELAGRLARIS